MVELREGVAPDPWGVDARTKMTVVGILVSMEDWDVVARGADLDAAS